MKHVIGLFMGHGVGGHHFFIGSQTLREQFLIGHHGCLSRRTHVFYRPSRGPARASRFGLPCQTVEGALSFCSDRAPPSKSAVPPVLSGLSVHEDVNSRNVETSNIKFSYIRRRPSRFAPWSPPPMGRSPRWMATIACVKSETKLSSAREQVCLSHGSATSSARGSNVQEARGARKFSQRKYRVTH